MALPEIPVLDLLRPNAPPLVLGGSLWLDPPTPLQWKTLETSVDICFASGKQEMKTDDEGTTIMASIDAAPLVAILPSANDERSSSPTTSSMATIAAVVGMVTGTTELDTRDAISMQDSLAALGARYNYEATKVRLLGIGRAKVSQFSIRRTNTIDRTHFKLAAITTLFLAAKLHRSAWSRELSPKKLAALSRGEISTRHIVRMELLLLETLDFQLHPPTGKDYLDTYYNVLPAVTTDETVAQEIYHRALFFVELAAYDSNLIGSDGSHVAIAAYHNALEGLARHQSPHAEEVHTPYSVLRTVLDENFGASYSIERTDELRDQLWLLYSLSRQFQVDGTRASANHATTDVAATCHASSSRQTSSISTYHYTPEERGCHTTSSPVSVVSEVGRAAHSGRYGLQRLDETQQKREKFQ